MLIGSLVATLVAATPFLFYLYEFVPDTQEWDTIFGKYKSIEYESANVAMWVFAMKVIPLLLSLIWFFTCRHWWYHALLVPITMFTYQCVVSLNFDARYLDVADIVWLLPIMAIVFPSIYLIRAKMFNKINDADKTLEELEEEFMIKPKGMWDKVKQYF
ncbi:MAG: hypothetical protein JJ870_06655 [Winogradskyella sp.]|nr:hypothetical protein [Winogradskyella sp.]